MLVKSAKIESSQPLHAQPQRMPVRGAPNAAWLNRDLIGINSRWAPERSAVLRARSSEPAIAGILDGRVALPEDCRRRQCIEHGTRSSSEDQARARASIEELFFPMCGRRSGIRGGGRWPNCCFAQYG